MNGFRITILTLLCLAVGLMFYAVLVVIPGWQEQYSVYQSTLRISEFEKKSDIHRRQMLAYDPDQEAPEVQQARLDQEEAARRSEAALNEAEESNVVAAARRREENARAESEAAAKESAASPVIGLVASYDPEWQCIMVRPSVPQAFLPGAVLAIRRNKVIICEAIVDNRDAESGQVSATVKTADFGGNANGEVDASKLVPAAGDEVMISPFPSASELRGSSGLTPSPVGDEPTPVEPAPQPAKGTPSTGETVTPPPPTEMPEDVKKALDSLKGGDTASPQTQPQKLPSLDAMLSPQPL